MKEVGLFGGSFNPIHLGHLLTAQAVVEACGLDRLYLVPCAVSPFKRQSPDMASAEDRLEMVRLSVRGAPGLACSSADIDRGGVSYALDTVREFAARYPAARISFVIGMDALADLHLWREAEELVRLCRMVVVERPGFDRPLSPDQLGFPPETGRELLSHIVRARSCDISASEIRRRIAAGRSIRYLVCPEVEAYVRDRKLYVPEEGGVAH